MTRIIMLQISLLIMCFILGYLVNGMINRRLSILEIRLVSGIGIGLLIVNWSLPLLIS